MNSKKRPAWQQVKWATVVEKNDTCLIFDSQPTSYIEGLVTTWMLINKQKVSWIQRHFTSGEPIQEQEGNFYRTDWQRFTHKIPKSGWSTLTKLALQGNQLAQTLLQWSQIGGPAPKTGRRVKQ